MDAQTDFIVDAQMDFFDEDQFVTDHFDAKTHYYTGLPNGEVLLATFNHIVPYPGVKRDYYW